MESYLKSKAISARKQRQQDEQRRLMNEAVDHELQAHYALFRHDHYAMRKARNVISRIQEPQHHLISSFVDTHWDSTIRIPYRVEYLKVAEIPMHDTISECIVSEVVAQTSEIVKNRVINDQVERPTLVVHATICEVKNPADKICHPLSLDKQPVEVVSVHDGTKLDHAPCGSERNFGNDHLDPEEPVLQVETIQDYHPVGTWFQAVDDKNAEFSNSQREWLPMNDQCHRSVCHSTDTILLFQVALLRNMVMRGYYLWSSIEVIYYQTVAVLIDRNPC